MTQSLERTVHRTVDGDEAYEIISRRRGEYKEHFRVDSLEVEFPSLWYELGKHGLYLARADDNVAGTFKLRGAAVALVEASERGQRVFSTASAGNHLSGCAAAIEEDMFLHGGVPFGAAPAKIANACRLAPYGNLEIHHVGKTVDETITWISANPDLGEYIAPFNNPNVIRGQGTLADDILAVHPQTKHLALPVGGAGLAAGVLQRLDELGRPDITVHAIEAEGSNSLSLSLQNGKPVAVEQPNKLYGGSAVQEVGHLAFAICNQFKDRLNIFTVSDDEVNRLIGSYEQDRHEHLLKALPAYEPTTLVAVAGLVYIVREHPTDDIVVIGTGHNDMLHPKKTQHANHTLRGTFPK